MRRLLAFATPALDMPYSTKEIGALFAILGAGRSDVVDDQTWRDLDLQQYCEYLGAETSLFGQQAMYLRLRTGRDQAGHSVAVSRYRALAADAELRALLAKILQPLRQLDCDVSAFVFKNSAVVKPWWLSLLLPFQIILLLAMTGSMFSFVFLVPLLALSVVAVVVQLTWQSAIERSDAKLASLRAMLLAAYDVAQLAKARGAPLIGNFLADLDKIKQNKDGITRTETGIPGARMYADWFFLKNIHHHFKVAKIIDEQQDFLQRCYLAVAELDADLAVARHIAVVPHFCWAEHHQNRHMALTSVLNPLLAGATPVSFASEGKGVFISGQNAAGKSTFLRTLGLNLLVGRALGFCYASQARIPDCLVYSSMQIADSMADGDSLYVAELKRAKQMLASSRGADAGVYLIDEIFRGTNHLESVAAAAAVLHELAQNALVIVSSHHLVLGALLEQTLTPMQVAAVGGAVSIEPGMLTQTNGIALLSAIGIDPHITQQAARVEAWLGPYLSHPKDCTDVLQD